MDLLFWNVQDTAHVYADYHKSQNLLVAERQKTSQLQIVAERTKLDVQSQKTLIDGLLDKNTELEAELKKHVSTNTSLVFINVGPVL